ncbi:hypothetical protein RJ640_024612 [Escallonia rubra]|uniref:CDP-diacylglycerol--inositol 3-phosphatidyltransferase n=1 Tax=Escallonia rubra TaxID=112253 RepID=A0AA88ULL5_9ASTE|nr:hypothetical protein RJ640_024612 [Escallonia rubra]
MFEFSFVCDALDGWFAGKFNQVLVKVVYTYEILVCILLPFVVFVSTFGAALDMVIDRISTACLLIILSQAYRPGLVFLSLLALDIASHWLQMYKYLIFRLEVKLNI